MHYCCSVKSLKHSSSRSPKQAYKTEIFGHRAAIIDYYRIQIYTSDAVWLIHRGTAQLAAILSQQFPPRLLNNFIARGIYERIKTEIGVAESHECAEILSFNCDHLRSKQTKQAASLHETRTNTSNSVVPL